MAAEIEADYVSGRTLYAQLRNATGQIYNTVSTFLEAYSTANIADYDLAMTEQGTSSGFYVGSMPAVLAGFYNVVVKERAGGAPAESDLTVAAGQIEWTGAAVVTMHAASIRSAVGMATANLDTQLAAIDTDVNLVINMVNDIGVAGAGLTAIPWNASWDAQVESEVADALLAYDAITQADLNAAVAPLSTLSAAGVRTAIGMAAADLDAQLAAMPTAVESADALLARDMALVVGAAARSPLNALRVLRNRHRIIAGVLEVYEEDDTTLNWTAIVSSNAAAQPIVGIDPV